MKLLERKDSLDLLTQLTHETSLGSGKIVLLSGEAGVGKTSLINQFKQELDSEIEVFWGGCDALFTPRPLGPIYDMASQLPGELAHLIESEDKRINFYAGFIKFLASDHFLKVIVFEDIHWADEATLDLIKYIGRRIGQLPVIFILTYRSEESGTNQMLTSTLGSLPTTDVKRIRIYPLSKESIDELMNQSGIYIDGLYELTGGNPFFVNEILNNKKKELPQSIREAVLSRTSRLDQSANEFLKTISVIPTKIELEFIRRLIPDIDELADHCIENGILMIENNLISFKHELTRLAILDSIPYLKTIQLHQKVLDCILEGENLNPYLALIVHHANHAKNKGILIEYAPLAAKQASRFSSHREASLHFLVAIENSDGLSVEEKLDLYDGRYYECYLSGQIEESKKAIEAMQEILEKKNDLLLLGELYLKFSKVFDLAGEADIAIKYIEKAVETLNDVPPCPQLALTLSNYSNVLENNERPYLSIEWGEKSLNLARKFKETQVEVFSLISIGKGKMFINDPEGESLILKSLELALKNEFDEMATRAYINLGLLNLSKRNYNRALKYLNEGMTFCYEKNIELYRLSMFGGQSKLELDLGNWDKAIELAEYVIRQRTINPLDSRIAFSVVGIIRARRNDPDFLINFQMAMPSANIKGECAFIAKMAKTEAYWLNNQLDEAIEELETYNMHLMQTNNPWKIGELAYWLWKGGRLNKIPENMARPYFLQITGRWREAADEWHELGVPYQQALALADGDEAARKKAFEILESLGAAKTISKLKQEMRETGLKNIPKGPRKSTRQNLAGLTVRQMEVLELLPENLTNIEIAEKLFISPKTVDHHISAILSKLGVSSRSHAAEFVKANS